jgi:hypothetical protein
MKIVINTDWGGFGLSEKAWENFLTRKGIEWEVEDTKLFSIAGKRYYRKGHFGEEKHYLCEYDLCKDRSDPDLVAVVEELMEESNGNYAALKIVEIPDDVDWVLQEYDGWEHIAEVHRTWR